jgi:hypothetical protein
MVTHKHIAGQHPQHTHAAKNTGAVFSVVWSDPRLYNRNQSNRTVSCNKRMRMDRVLVICEVSRLAITDCGYE